MAYVLQRWSGPRSLRRPGPHVLAALGVEQRRCERADPLGLKPRAMPQDPQPCRWPMGQVQGGGWAGRDPY